MEGWIKKCEMRQVNVRAVLDKLQMCREAGIDVDRIPLSLEFGELLRMSTEKIRGLTEIEACHR